MALQIKKEIKIRQISNKLYEDTLDFIVSEMPLKIYINYELYTVLMCTPMDLRELTVGYLFSEGIITSTDDIVSIEEKFEDRVCVVLKDEIKVNFEGIKAKVSGCGNASTQIEYLELGLSSEIRSNNKISYKSIIKLMKEFNKSSELFKQTGGVHSCALCSNDEIVIFTEDIGRHNALDKVIGKALVNNIASSNKFLLTTGRISSDIIVKAVKAGIPIVASHSAPTDLALNIAETSGVTVIGFVRGLRMNLYTYKERIIDI
ncbi:formate dehydrogenase accessory sulfurtransferase FdhD [Candidatus Clostridium radicumherbarum]|uniref:Sulfur carrier protein FdhD n=1 Tax=Candidatus Clostridium radicumherbarum TaxID=3381662 RepID=A0ABW8TUV1_9CLOT